MTSTPDLSQLDPDEQLRRNALGMRASVVPQQSTSANGPVIAPPSVAQGVNLPPVGPQPNKLGQDESQLEQLKSSPRFMGSQSGIASLKPQSTIGKIGKGILGGLDIIGSTLAPGLTARIPGTSMHHALLENQAAGNVAEDVAQQGKEAEAGEAKSRAHLADVEAKEKQDALPGMDEQAFAELIKKGVDPVEAYKQVKQAGQKPTVPNEFSEWVAQNPGKTVADFEKMKADARPHQGNDFEQYYQQYLHDNNLPDSARNRLMARQQYQAAGQMPQREPQQFVFVPDDKGGMVAQVVRPGMTVPKGAMTPQQMAKAGEGDQITPAAQTILQSTEPVKQQVDQLLEALKPYNTPEAGRLTMDRLKYALGEPSAPGELASQISKLELNRVVDAARILKGSSRAYQAIELALKHTPNPWVDKPQLMYQKLQNIRQNLDDVEKDAVAFGKKGQTAGEAQQHLSGTSQMPHGATGKARGSDGKWHWTDGKSDLGVAE